MRQDIASSKHVVISGSLVDWGDELIPLFTLAIRLETATSVRIERIRKRERARYGSRIDPGGDMYQNHLAFLDWAASYDDGDISMRSKANHDKWEKLLSCRRLLLDGSESLENNYKLVKQYLSE